MSDSSTHAPIDLRGTPCPLNWVKTKLRLEKLPPGAVVEVLVDDGPPARNVPRSAGLEGYQVVAVTPVPGGVRVAIRRP